MDALLASERAHLECHLRPESATSMSADIAAVAVVVADHASGDRRDLRNATLARTWRCSMAAIGARMPVAGHRAAAAPPSLAKGRQQRSRAQRQIELIFFGAAAVRFFAYYATVTSDFSGGRRARWRYLRVTKRRFSCLLRAT